MTEMAVIGRVIRAQGVDGALKVQPYSDYPERIKTLTRVFLEKNAVMKPYLVTEAFIHGRFWVFTLEGIVTAEEAESLKGALVKIPLSERVPLPEDTYYLDEIIGLGVYTVSGQLLGCVSDVLKTGSNDVYVVSRSDQTTGKKQDLLIPALKTVVVRLEPALKRMEVDLPEGLL
ncbi:MAG: 16S rRNA processing protein RimM [Dethiobacter sp.]|nr:16S rRNA processing protein RimM [Dethiobacter sp.]